MKKQFRIIRKNGLKTSWYNLSDWSLDNINFITGIIYQECDNWQMEFREVEA